MEHVILEGGPAIIEQVADVAPGAVEHACRHDSRTPGHLRGAVFLRTGERDLNFGLAVFRYRGRTRRR